MEDRHGQNNSNKHLTLKFEAMLENEQMDFFDVEEFETIIEGYVHKNEIKKALKACRLALSQHPYSEDLTVHKAQLLAMLEKFDKALELLNNHPVKTEEILLTTAYIFIRKEEFVLALNTIKEAKEKYGDNSDIHYCQGAVYMQNQDYENAIKHFKKSLKFDLENEAALYDLAFCLEVTSKLKESIGFYEKLIDKDPYSHSAWYNLGIVHNKLENFNDALDAFEYSTIIKEDFASGYYNKANTLINLERFEEAIENFEKCMKHENVSADVYAKIGECYEYSEKWDEAQKFYKKALELDFNKEEALFGMGITLYYKQRYTEAVHYFKKTIALHTSHAFYWHMLAKAEYKLGNEVSAIEAFEEANKLQPTDKDIWLNWAEIYAENGDYATAKTIITQGIEEIAEDPELHYMAFVYMMKNGNYKEAFQYLENALILNSEMQAMLYDHFEDLEAQKAIAKFIDELK